MEAVTLVFDSDIAIVVQQYFAFLMYNPEGYGGGAAR